MGKIYTIKATGTRWTLYQIIKGKQKRVTTAVDRNDLVQTVRRFKLGKLISSKSRKNKLK